MDELHITRFTLDHLDDVHAIERQCFTHPWTRAMLEHELQSSLSVFWVALLDGAVAGYLDMMHVCDEGHIASVAVRPDMRRRGVARALMERMLGYARQNQLALLTLEVRASGKPAQELYRSFGFVRAGLRRDYYESPREDAVIMTLML